MAFHPPFPLAVALRESLRGGYSLKKFRDDTIAAVTVSLVALPLAMALAIAVGLPPQHGIYTAIVAGILTPLLGGSAMQVSGPTAAFVVIVAPIVAEHGLRGLIITQIMAGIMLVLLAWAKLGRFITVVPYPVTTGFTAGIAVVLATLSLNDILGLGIDHLSGSFVHKLVLLAQHLPQIRWQEAAIGLVSLLVMFTGRRIISGFPSAILGVAAGTALALLLSHFGIEVATIGSRFSYDTPQGLIGHGIPPYAPVLHGFGGDGLFAWPDVKELQLLLMPAAVIAALAALESLLSASVADGLSRTKHHPNAELGAIGIANIFSGLASGIPATGAIARTTTNIKSGARTPLASMMHAALILAYVLALAPLISYLPMASLAALLMLTAYNMSHYRQFYRILRIAPRHDIIVLLVCFGLTVFIDMVAGVAIGMLLAAVLFIQRISAMTEIHVEEGGHSRHLALPENVMITHISGPLFFATVERVLDRTSFLRSRIDTLILDLQQVPLIDMSGLVAMKQLLTSDTLARKTVYLCAKPDLLAKLTLKLADVPHPNIHLVNSVETAITAATAPAA
jgi:SulP family sulfate permease